ncbi:MAG: cupin domain-containing protein [Deltaproteobacteria bacterium]|nr:cupin domain-containing protein [Deltaproteobacteria bacterium]
MKIVKWQDVETAQNPHKIDARKLYDQEAAQVMHLTLQPGEQLIRHMTPVDVIFYVLEGTGVVEVGDEQQEVGPDSLIESPAKIPHCWYNRSESPLRFLVIKTPRPTSTTKLL